MKTHGTWLAALLDRHLSKRWLAIVLGVSILGNGLGLAAYCLRNGRTAEEGANREIGLGGFRFTPEHAEGSPVMGAEFSLHIALLEEVEPMARPLLAQRKYRVQEGIEELLRKAHGGDFRDPSLADLKRQLQERVNEALGMRAISEVIITGLQVQRAPQTLGDATETAGTAPWADGDKPAG